MNMFSYGEPMFNENDIGNYVSVNNGKITYIHPNNSGPKYKHGLRDNLNFDNYRELYTNKDTLSCSVEYNTTWCYNNKFKEICDEYNQELSET